MNINRKNILIIVSVLMTIFIISGSTFAYWKWRSNEASKTNITLTTAMNFSCSADGGGNITEQDATLIPTYCTNSPYVIKREITTNVINNGSTNVYLDLWLKVNSISRELSDSPYFSYALTDSPDGCTSGNVLSNGNFSGVYTGITFDILTNDVYSNSDSRTYYLYIWLDVEETNNDTQDQQFNIELSGKCSTTNSSLESKANPPQLVDGLIPVKLSDTGGTVTTVSLDDPDWYNYAEKKWANAVLVRGTEGTAGDPACKGCPENPREYYSNNIGVTVDSNTILAYYVWIPRYSYKVWKYSGVSAKGQEKEIDIKFIRPGTIETATQNDEWYTHPAFWWDKNSNGVREAGEELSGIWVGKFETSHRALSINANNTTANNLGTCTEDSCTNYSGLRILPNVRSLRYNTISRFFYASYHMTDTNNPYGLSSSTVDSHAMKNSEWGAAAYLSHSKYGINGEVRLNNQNGYLTGCGAATANASGTATCSNKYAGTVTSFPQSTTGNVTGIFDMAGGSKERVMGNYNNLIKSSDFTSMPDSKYYDKYTVTSLKSCTLEMCGGHGLNETYNWYNDYPGFLETNYSWLIRGGLYSATGASGSFWTYNNNGSSNATDSFRLILIAK